MHDFAADSFPTSRAKPARWESCLNDFCATEDCLNIAMLAYNLMSLFRQAALKTADLQNGSQNV